MDWRLVIGVAFAAYLLGSIPSAYIVGRLTRGLDIRSVGSRNVGAGNVYRCAGFVPGSVVLAADVGKGMLAMQVPVLLGDPGLMYMSGVWAVAGHNWSVFLRFSGGKGVATAIGTFLIAAPVLTLLVAVPSLVITALARHSNPGSVTGIALLNILSIATGQPVARIVFFLTVTGVILAAQVSREGLPWAVKSVDEPK